MSYNRLSHETSPYLRQHADNPVHWWPWCDEALQKAREEDKPILLSVGYSACHWCHVMAHESFGNERIARLMNTHFINIKVDREERPDIDRHYMQALHMMGQRGGWPLTMFLLPDGTPFWGGTYFPPEPKFGQPSFPQVLSELARLWKQDRRKLQENAAAIADQLAQKAKAARPSGLLPAEFPSRAARALYEHFDKKRGGLKGAPKFPQCPVLELLWSTGLDEPVLTTLTHLCQGGIYDHLGGGFARYSTDEDWLVPHFEKMLYDNAQILDLLARAWARTQEPLFRQRIEETISFLQRDIHVKGCGLASSLDADSEGAEGLYYTWEHAELQQIIPRANQELFFQAYGVSRRGNFEGRTILNRLSSLRLLDDASEALLARERQRLLQRRAQRIPPARDDKILASWNGLAIRAITHAAIILERAKWLDWAKSLFSEAGEKLALGHGLSQGWLDKPSRTPATADGLANMIAAALSLYEATGQKDFLHKASTWTSHMVDCYLDESSGVFRFTHESISRSPHQIFCEDEATPNYNATMIANLRKLAFITANKSCEEQAARILRHFSMTAAASPLAHAAFLTAFHEDQNIIQASLFHGKDSRETMDSRETHPLLSALAKATAVSLDIRHIHPGDPIAQAQDFQPGKDTLLLCRGKTCSQPITSAQDIASAIGMLQ